MASRNCFKISRVLVIFKVQYQPPNRSYSQLRKTIQKVIRHVRYTRTEHRRHSLRVPGILRTVCIAVRMLFVFSRFPEMVP